MPSHLTATYEERHEAERVRERLVTLGVDPAGIRIEDERAATGGPGVFDRLAELLAPANAAKPRWQLDAEVAPELEARARSALQGGSRWAEPEGAIEERTYVFRETSERLVIEKQAVVREEVVLAPRVQERVEQIHDTVRRMDADVERLEPASADQNGSIPK